MPDAAEALLARVRALIPLLHSHARASEEARQPQDEVVRALRESGCFDLMVPMAYGGLELDLDTFLDVGLALGEGDTSAAWVATFYIEHNWILCQFPEAFQKELYRERSHVLAPASIAPKGVAEPVSGGYRLNGRWQWATGICHAEWAIVGARVLSDDPVPDLRFFALPRGDFEQIDTWFVDGLCGTGSHDLAIEGKTVPEEQSVSMRDLANGRAHGSQIHEGPLYRTPMMPILALAASAPAVGLARASLREVLEEIPTREDYIGMSKRMLRPAVQARLARAELEVGQAEWLLREIVREVRVLRSDATVTDRSRWLAAAALAVAQSKGVIGSLADLSGASAHFRTHPLQRAVRDIAILSSHIVFDLDQRLENFGRTLLGLEPTGPF